MSAATRVCWYPSKPALAAATPAAASVHVRTDGPRLKQASQRSQSRCQNMQTIAPLPEHDENTFCEVRIVQRFLEPPTTRLNMHWSHYWSRASQTHKCVSARRSSRPCHCRLLCAMTISDYAMCHSAQWSTTLVGLGHQWQRYVGTNAHAHTTYKLNNNTRPRRGSHLTSTRTHCNTLVFGVSSQTPIG